MINETWDGSTEDNTWSAETNGTGTLDDDDTTDPPLTTVDRFCTQQLEATVSASGRRTYRYDLCTGAPAFCDGTPVITGTIYIRLYFVLGALTMVDGDQTQFVTLNNDGADPEDTDEWAVAVAQNATSNLVLSFRANGGSRDTYDIPDAADASTKYRIEYSVNGTTGAWEWWVNGVSQGTGTNFVFSPRYLHVGWGRADSTASGTYFIDNVAVSTSAIGD